MLRWAGVGVAMAEAAPDVRAAADVVVARAELPALFLRLAAAPVGTPSAGEQPPGAEAPGGPPCEGPPVVT
jgi:hypothetical protein